MHDGITGCHRSLVIFIPRRHQGQSGDSICKGVGIEVLFSCYFQLFCPANSYLTFLFHKFRLFWLMCFSFFRYPTNNRRYPNKKQELAFVNFNVTTGSYHLSTIIAPAHVAQRMAFGNDRSHLTF